MKRKLNYESLEQRQVLSASSVLADYVDVGALQVEPMYTSFDAPSNHVTATGTKFDGVVKLTMQTNLGTFLGSGTLLPTGRHILTAAHNVTGAGSQQFTTVSSITALFELPSGNVIRTVSLPGTNVNPNWNPNDIGAGGDLAVLELTTAAPTEVQRFDIYRNSFELQSVGEKAGYGQAGQGVITLSAGTKRDGDNLYELYWDSSEDILVYDFDNGNSSNDTIGLLTGQPNLGLGNAEVMTAPGDSGGPTLLTGLLQNAKSTLVER